MIYLASTQLDDNIKKGMKAKQAWDLKCSLQASEAAKCHMALQTFRCFRNYINDFHTLHPLAPLTNKVHLDSLLELFGIESLLEHCIGLVEVEGVDRKVVLFLE